MQFKRKALRLFLHRGERFVRACSFFMSYYEKWDIIFSEKDDKSSHSLYICSVIQ